MMRELWVRSVAPRTMSWSKGLLLYLAQCVKISSGEPSHGSFVLHAM